MGEFVVLGNLPGIKFLVSQFLCKGALGNTFEQVFLVHDAFVIKNSFHRIGGFSACSNPVERSVEVNLDLGWYCNRVVGANFLDEFSVSWCTTIRNYYMIKRLTFFTIAL